MKHIWLSLLIILGLIFSLGTNSFAMNIVGIELSIKNFVIFVILLMIFSIISAIYRSKKIYKKTQRTNEVLSQIVKKDSTWNEEELVNNVKNTFYRIMNNLAHNEFEELKETIHPHLYSKWEKHFKKFEGCKPENLLNNEVKEVTIVDINNFLDDEKDNYTVKIEFMASEYIVDKKGNLICDNYDEEAEQIALGQFTEYWQFEREGKEWLLYEAHRSNKWKKFINDENFNEEE